MPEASGLLGGGVARATLVDVDARRLQTTLIRPAAPAVPDGAFAELRFR